MKKLIYAAAFGIGYVLGTRAGRERYEQIRDAAEKVQTDPRVQDAVRKAEGLAQDAVTLAKDDERLADLAHSVKDSAQKVREQAVGVVSSVRQNVEGDDATGNDDSTEGARESAAEATQKVKAAAEAARGETNSGDTDGETWPPHPDDHIPESEDEVVFTTGPDDKD